jgi:MFS family permease
LFSEKVKFVALSPLTNPSFRRLWLAAWFWYTSELIASTTLSWMVLELTDSPSRVALLGVSRSVPMFFFSFIAGGLADRFPKKRVMIGSQTMSLVASSSMTYILLTDQIQYWYAYLYMIVMGIIFSLDWSTRRSYYSEIFDVSKLSNVMSLESVAFTGSLMLGTFMAGSLIALVGYGYTFIVVVSMYLVGYILLLSTRILEQNRSNKSKESIGTQLTEAIKVVRLNKIIRTVILVTVLLNLFAYPYNQIVSVIARDVLGVGSVLYGVLGASAGLGSFVGSFIIASLDIRRHMRLFILGSSLMLLSLFVFAFSPVFIISSALLFLTGLGISGFSTMQPTLILGATPPEMRGRAMGVVPLAIGLGPIGVLTIGYLAEHIGAQAALALLAGTGFLLITFLRRKIEGFS